MLPTQLGKCTSDKLKSTNYETQCLAHSVPSTVYKYSTRHFARKCKIQNTHTHPSTNMKMKNRQQPRNKYHTTIQKNTIIRLKVHR